MLFWAQDAMGIRALPSESGHPRSISGTPTISHWHWPSHFSPPHLILLSLTGFFNSSLACFTRYLPRSHYLKVVTDHVKDHSLCKTSPHSSLKQWLSYLNRVSEKKSSSLEGFDLSSNRKSKVRNQVETKVENHSPGQTSLNYSHGKRKCFWLSQQNLLETRDIFKTFRHMFIATPQYAGRWVFEQSCHSINYFHVLKLRYGDQ